MIEIERTDAGSGRRVRYTGRGAHVARHRGTPQSNAVTELEDMGFAAGTQIAVAARRSPTLWIPPVNLAADSIQQLPHPVIT
jgi:hypothetical protein